MRCVIINEAKSAPLTAMVTPAWIAQVGEACSVQLARDVMPIWGGPITNVRAGSGPTDVEPGEMVFALVDSLPDVPGAVAYHDVNGTAVPVAFLALTTCTTLNDVSTAISHEMCETQGDPACNRWVDDGRGHEVALELCDAIEANGYEVEGVMVSDFLLPAFFAPGATTAVTFMQTGGGTGPASFPTAPMATASGGYQIERSAGSGETQITGKMNERRRHHAQHWSSRVARRGAHVEEVTT
jgi:hypothetical protein